MKIMKRRGRPPGAEPLIKTGIAIHESVYYGLKDEAELQDRSLNWLMNEAIKQYLERQEKLNK